MMMWPGDRRPSYEELAAENAALRETIEDLQAVVTALRAEIAELKRQLGQDSSNSSKPPSTDSPFAKPAPKSLRRQSGRKPGGQPGHPGSTLPLVADPKTRLRHEPGACGGCGADLAEAPDGVTAPVLYGPQITAIVLYRYVGQFLSKKRAAQALAELFGTPLSEGTVAAMCERAASGLDGFLDVVRDRIADAESAGFDETGLRVASSLHWVHCARTGKYTLITCHAKRGKQGIDDMGVLGRFKGVAVHDAWAPYDTYLDPAHQLCCAHALRELQGVADAAPPDAQWCWATQVS
ncbi:MAG: transposase, partial [Mycobacterium sp.]|nr:transposase [Mycobacterium sp.]